MRRMNTDQMTRRNLFVPDALWDQAKQLADAKGVPTATVVRTALEKYLAAVKKAQLAAQEAAQHG